MASSSRRKNLRHTELLVPAWFHGQQDGNRYLHVHGGCSTLICDWRVSDQERVVHKVRLVVDNFQEELCRPNEN